MTRKKNNTLNKLIKKRIKCFFIVFLLLFTYLFYEIVCLTILKNEEYTNRVKNQNLEIIDLNSGRGIIYDRNNIS